MPDVISSQAAMNPRAASVLHLWETQLRTLHAGHWNAARVFEKRNNFWGLAASILAAIGGTAAMASLMNSSDVWMRTVAGLFSITAAIVSSAQTYYKSSEQAEQHRTAAVKFGKLRRQFEETLALGLPPNEQQRAAALDEFRKQWGDTDAESPAIPPTIYEAIKREVESEHVKAIFDAAA